MFPAGRAEVAQRFDEVVSAAEDLETEGTSIYLLEPIASSVRECLRFPAISAVLPQLATVLAANEEARESRVSALAALNSPGSPTL